MTTPTPQTPLPGELDVLAIKTAYRRRVRERCPEHEDFAIALLQDLPPERWRLEWHGPWWLGGAFGVDPALSQELVLCNVLGLVSIRLEDDLRDGDVAPGERIAAELLSQALFDAAVEPYRRRFPRDSVFWTHFERLMRAWRARGGTSEPPTLVGVGAPLKVAVIASCLASGRPDILPEVEDLFDEAIESLVLDDHVADWEADVSAGRWNAFVESIQPGIDRDDPTSVRRAVLVALLTTDALSNAFTRIVAGFQRAAGRARALDAGLAPLADALLAMAEDARTRGAGLVTHYRQLGEEAAKLLIPARGDRGS